MWLIRHEAARDMARAMEAGLAPTAEQIQSFVEKHALHDGEAPRNLKLAGDVAQINVHGVLTPKPDFFARFFFGGNTTYEEIMAAIAMAEADPAIKKVVFNIDSPGGHVAGLFDAFSAIEAMQKPRHSVAAYACSAAYGIASVTGRIEATNAAVELGSVGVAVTYFDFPELIDITSTEAPDKRPDPTTEEGRAVIRKHLDAIHQLFAEAIAKGRGTTVDKVNAEFGRGAVLLAGDAKKRGMIDKIQKPQLRAVTISDSDANMSGLARSYRHMVASGQIAEPAARGDGAQGARPSLTAIEGGAPNDSTAREREETPAQPANQKASAGTPPTGPNDPQPTTSASEPQRKAKKMDLETLKKDHPDVYKAAMREGREEAEAEAKVTTEKTVKDALAKEADRVEAFLVAGEQSGDMKTAVDCIRKGNEMTTSLMTKFMFAGRNKQDGEARQAESDAADPIADGAKPKNGAQSKAEEVADCLDKIEAGELSA